MKDLFKNNKRKSYKNFTQEAHELDLEIQRAISPVVQKYRDVGFSANDIDWVIQHVARVLHINRNGRYTPKSIGTDLRSYYRMDI